MSRGLLELEPAELTEEELTQIGALVRKLAGINLHGGKRQLIKARLGRRLRMLGMSSFREYLEYVAHDRSGDELCDMLDALSTNVTSFFREPDHFDYLREEILPRAVAAASGGPRRLRIWSAGCSSGEEAYSIAIEVCEGLPDLAGWDVRILGTDLSHRVLAQAQKGIYGPGRLRDIPGALRHKHFVSLDPPSHSRYQVHPTVRRLVHFAHLNLMAPWPMRGPFDAIFCRNVMIYFDRATQRGLVDRFYDLLAPGGLFFVGHAESLVGMRQRLAFTRPGIYRK